jgi:hypothetical protein
MPPRRRKAGRSRITLDISESGPLLEGKGPEVIRAFLDETKLDVAQRGHDMLQQAMPATFKHSTGAYAKRVIVERAQKYNDQVITDQGWAGTGVPGPWLEGTSERNKTTRFKGYRLFRKTRLKLRKEVTPIAQANLDRYLSRLGGG